MWAPQPKLTHVSAQPKLTHVSAPTKTHPCEYPTQHSPARRQTNTLPSERPANPTHVKAPQSWSRITDSRLPDTQEQHFGGARRSFRPLGDVRKTRPQRRKRHPRGERSGIAPKSPVTSGSKTPSGTRGPRLPQQHDNRVPHEIELFRQRLVEAAGHRVTVVKREDRMHREGNIERVLREQ